jgi:carboxyl-terminal processing protease
MFAVLSAWLALLSASVAGDPILGSPAPEVERLLDRGVELERAGDWGRAVQLYEGAAKANPASLLLRQRLHHSEVRYRLSRRYHDTSYRQKMLRLSRAHALQLYDEITRKVDEYYVEPLEPTKQFQSCIDHLWVVCEDPQFNRAATSGDAASRVEQFRGWLRQWKAVSVRDWSELRSHMLTITDQAQRLFDTDDTAMVLEFIYGLCESLDDYSACLTPDRLNDLYAVIDGNFVGIGVELRSDDQGLLVVTVLPRSPAAETGMRGGDHIVAIDSVSTVGLPTEDAANRLQGAEGTQVEIAVQSPGEAASRRHVLTRREVEVQSVTQAQVLAGGEGIGYVQLSGFQKSTLGELERSVAALERQGMRSLILDLRGNPGGLLNGAVDVSDKFLTDGVIVSTRGRADGQSHTYRAHRPGTWSFPLVVLIDGESASASEILAGAIQDHHRGTIVGAKSFGKGSVQSIFPLDTVDAGVRLTTAKFYSPRGRSYCHQGVNPDIDVPQDKSVRAAEARSAQIDPTRDAQLAAALQACRRLVGSRATN